MFWRLNSRRLFSVVSKQLENKSLPQIHVELRHQHGSRHSRNLRLKNQIPGTIYGSNWPETTANAEKISIILKEKDVKTLERTLFNSMLNTIFEVVINDNVKIKAIIRQYQLCPYTDQPLSVNFLRYKPGTSLKIPIQFINEDDNIEIKRGGYLHVITSFAKVVSFRPDDIPAYIIADVTKLKAGDSIRLSDCDIPSGIVPLLGRGTDIVLAKLEKQ